MVKYYRVTLSYFKDLNSIPKRDLYTFLRNHNGRVIKQNHLERNIKIIFESSETKDIVKEQIKKLEGFNIEDLVF